MDENIVARAKQILTLKSKDVQKIYGDDTFGFDLPIEDFAAVMAAYVLPQSYGSRFQNYIKDKCGFKSVKASEDKGDCSDVSGHMEIKVSIITPTNPTLNLVQVRLWQNVSYVCAAIDIRKTDIRAFFFKLSHIQMEQEAKRMGFCSAHGTKTATANNEKIELRGSLVVDENDIHFSRWVNSYSYDLFHKH